MSTYSLSHLTNRALQESLAGLVCKDRTATASMVAHIAEFDARRLYRPAACPSMYCYCIRELKFSEDAACMRIRAARLARKFPVIFPAIADGRLTLSVVALVSRHATRQNGNELLAAAMGQTLAKVREMLAARFPRQDVPTEICSIPQVIANSGPVSVSERVDFGAALTISMAWNSRSAA